jgi:hypothetical protein
MKEKTPAEKEEIPKKQHHKLSLLATYSNFIHKQSKFVLSVYNKPEPAK